MIHRLDDIRAESEHRMPSEADKQSISISTYLEFVAGRYNASGNTGKGGGLVGGRGIDLRHNMGSKGGLPFR